MSFRPEGNSFEEHPTDTQIAWGEQRIPESTNLHRAHETMAGEDVFMQELLPAFHGGFEDTEPAIIDFTSVEALKADLLARGFDLNQFDFSRLDTSLRDYQE
jgi:hypothetical protein